MKKLLICIILIFPFAAVGYAGWGGQGYDANNLLYIPPSTGNYISVGGSGLGIGTGTTTPVTPLEVNGDISMDTGTGGSVLCLTTTHSMGHCASGSSCLVTCTCSCVAN